jgi:hypothetical protein
MWSALSFGFVEAFLLDVFIAPFAGILAVLAGLLIAEPENRGDTTFGALLGMAAGFGVRIMVGTPTGLVPV